MRLYLDGIAPNAVELKIRKEQSVALKGKLLFYLGMFYDLSASKEFVLYSTIGKLSDKRIDLNEQFENTQKVCLMNLEKFVECVNECNFSPDVVNVDYSVCSGCDYKSCCRRTFNVSKKSD